MLGYAICEWLTYGGSSNHSSPRNRHPKTKLCSRHISGLQTDTSMRTTGSDLPSQKTNEMRRCRRSTRRSRSSRESWPRAIRWQPSRSLANWWCLVSRSTISWGTGDTQTAYLRCCYPAGCVHVGKHTAHIYGCNTGHRHILNSVCL
jgi:hypothetical protein